MGYIVHVRKAHQWKVYRLDVHVGQIQVCFALCCITALVEIHTSVSREEPLNKARRAY